MVPRPALFERLGSAARVTVASAGSGKTVLLRSWIAEAGMAGRAAWVAAGRGERDPQRFWLSVFGALRQTGPGAGLVRAVSAAPELDEPTLAVLHARTEGWAAGLRLAALSLARHPDPARFAAEFSGTERTVAEYLLAEVLDRQPAAVRLLRTSILERVNGELTDLLTGDEGGERVARWPGRTSWPRRTCLVERQARHRTAHPALVAEAHSMLAGPAGRGRAAWEYGAGAPLPENLVPA